MKTVSLFFFAILFMVACSKKDSNPQNQNPVVVLPSDPDTLSAGWTKVGSIPIAETVTDVFFTDQANGYLTTDYGIYRSSDAGSSWSKINGDAGFINIAAYGSNACFVNSTDNVYVTLDHGASIQKINKPHLPNSYNFQDCFYTSSNNCYLQSGLYFFNSINAGVSFDSLYLFPSVAGGTAASIYFINNLNGWVSRDSKIFNTTDGGISWNIQKTLSNTTGPVSFYTGSNGFIGDYGQISKTINGGATWEPLSDFNELITDIQFLNSSTGYCCGGTHIYKTEDAGTTWSPVVSLGAKTVIEIHFIDEHHGWACGAYGYVLRFNL